MYTFINVYYTYTILKVLLSNEIHCDHLEIYDFRKSCNIPSYIINSNSGSIVSNVLFISLTILIVKWPLHKYDVM